MGNTSRSGTSDLLTMASSSNRGSSAEGSADSDQRLRERPAPPPLPLHVIQQDDTAFIEDAFRNHEILKQYTIEAPLLPSSGRMTRTYRIKRRPEASSSSTIGAGAGGTNQQPQHFESTAVIKVLLVESDGTMATLEAQRKELQYLKDSVRTHHKYQFVAPFLAWFADTETKALPPARRRTSAHHHHSTTSSATGGNTSLPEQQLLNQGPVNVRPVFLLRPHVYSTLSDRLASRPWLTMVEKLWITYQLLHALDQLHRPSNGGGGDESKSDPIVHGFLTTENIGLTSFNSIILLDFSHCYKSTQSQLRIADDDPSEYLYYFQLQQQSSSSGQDTSSATIKRSEKRCYLAPERFYTPSRHRMTSTTATKEDDLVLDGTEIATGSSNEAAAIREQTTSRQLPPLTTAMDIFSAGCVLVELFLNGERCFDLGDLLEYRRLSVAVTSRQISDAAEPENQIKDGKDTSPSDTKAQSTITLPSQLQQKLAKIESSHIRAACRHMLHIDPTQRLSAKEYLAKLEDQMPESFGSCLRPLMEHVMTTAARTPDQAFGQSNMNSPDARLAYAASQYSFVLWETVGVQDRRGQAYFNNVLGRVVLEAESQAFGGESLSAPGETEQARSSSERKISDVASPSSAMALDLYTDLLAETDELLRRLESLDMAQVPSDQSALRSGTGASALSNASPESMDLEADKAADDKTYRSPLCQNSLLIFLQMVLSTIRHVQRPVSKLVGLQLIERLAHFSPNDARLQRIVPVTVSLLHDQDPLVRAAVIRTLTYTLSTIESFSPSDSNIFPQYIFKRVAHLISDPSLVVRVAFAKCIAFLAETAHRFLDISHTVRLYEAIGTGTGAGTPLEDGNRNNDETNSHVFTSDLTKLLDDDSNMAALSSTEHTDSSLESSRSDAARVAAGKMLVRDSYRGELASLQETVSRWVIHIATDQSDHSALPKRALLCDLGRLCSFFGDEGVMSFILPQILAFLNDRRNWELRADLFEALPAVCHVIGRASTEEFVLPCVEIGLVDVQEAVISRAISCWRSLVEMNLVSKSVLLGENPPGVTEASDSGWLRKYSALLVHPSSDIRSEAADTFCTVWNAVGSPTREVYIVPVLLPLFRFRPNQTMLSHGAGLLSCIEHPMSRERFRELMTKYKALSRPGTSTEGAWTSIGIQMNEGSDKATSKRNLSSAAASGRRGSTSPSEVRVEYVEQYMKMYARHSPGSLRENESQGLLESKMANGIEGAVKLAQRIMFPRHDGRSKTDSIPSWYSSLRESALEENTNISEESAIRSVSALGHVYGLSILGPEEGGSATIVGAADDAMEQEDYMAKTYRALESKILEAAHAGQWGAETLVDPDLADTTLLVTKLKSLSVPPLPPNTSSRETVVSARTVQPKSPSKDAPTADWKPRVNALVATSAVGANGHTAPVVRLSVSIDNRFFVSGSHDGTCRVWEIPQVQDSSGLLGSVVVYDGHSTIHGTRVNDVAMIEGSHSIISGASNGCVHVWRVDMVAPARPSSSQGEYSQHPEYSKVVGTSVVRKMDPGEGEVLAVSHFNSLSTSVAIFGTQKGTVHSWDLRCAREPFNLKHGPELGHLTSVVLGSDRQWIVSSTNRGYIALWDVRFQQAVKLWRHSGQGSISRLATSFVAPPQSWGYRSSPDSARPFIFASSGNNECAMFDALTGSCRECFRVVAADSRGIDPHVEEPPTFHEVRPALLRQSKALSLDGNSVYRSTKISDSINCMVGSVGPHSNCFLITGGADSSIRFWDFSTPSKCYTVSGPSQIQGRPSFERIDFDSQTRLMLCRQPRSRGVGDYRLFGPESRHSDSIQDLKVIDGALLSCSRDCTVKVWR